MGWCVLPRNIFCDITGFVCTLLSSF